MATWQECNSLQDVSNFNVRNAAGFNKQNQLPATSTVQLFTQMVGTRSTSQRSKLNIGLSRRLNVLVNKKALDFGVPGLRPYKPVACLCPLPFQEEIPPLQVEVAGVMRWLPPEHGMSGPIEVRDPRRLRRYLETRLQR